MREMITGTYLMLDSILGKEIASYVKRHKMLVIIAIVLTTVSSVFALVPAILLQPFVDEGMNAGAELVTWKIPWIVFDSGPGLSWRRTELIIMESVSPNALLMVLTFVAVLSIICKSITTYMGGMCAAAFSNRAVKSLRVDLFKKFVSLPMGFFHHKKSGELVARATADLAVMQSLISNLLIGLIEYPLTAAIFLVYLCVMDYKLVLLALIVGPVIIGITRLFGKKVKKHAKRVQDATADVTADYQETILCMKIVHGFFKGGYEVKVFRDLAKTLYKRVMKWERWRQGLGPMMDATVFIVMPLALISGKVFLDHSLGELMAISFAFSRIYSPVKKLAKVYNGLRTLQGATGRVFGIMNTVPAIREHPEAKYFPGIKNP